MTMKNMLSAYVMRRYIRCGREQMIRRVITLVRSWLDGKPAAEKLRLLFELDAELYRLQGPASSEYEGGPHAKHRIIRYHDFFVDHLNPSETVLDIGCGDGTLSRAMAERAGVHV